MENLGLNSCVSR